MSSAVSRPKAAASNIAFSYFDALLTFETDCSDVYHAISNQTKDFVLLDVRAQSDFDQGHVIGALCLPHSQMNQRRLAEYDQETLFVVYCAGPHCNGADKAALKLAKLGRPVKKMIGGVTGWLDEGLDLEV